MSGLIEGAKKKIWSVANRMLDGDPRPEVRIGLVGDAPPHMDYLSRNTTDKVCQTFTGTPSLVAGL